MAHAPTRTRRNRPASPDAASKRAGEDAASTSEKPALNSSPANGTPSDKKIERFEGDALVTYKRSDIAQKLALASSDPQEVDKTNGDVISSSGMDKKSQFIALVSELFSKTPEEAKAEYEQRLRQKFLMATVELYLNRPKGESAIDFYERVWSERISTGEFYAEDIEDHDYSVIDGVLNACKRLAASNSAKPSEFYPPNFPPPRTPNPVKTKAEKRRAADLVRQQRHQERRKTGHSSREP